jgi:cytochrome c553
MNKNLAIAVCSLAMFAAVQNLRAAEPTNEADEAAKVLATEVCSVCHGPGGHSTFSGTPSLAAQPRHYLQGKLTQFRNRALAKAEDHIDVLGLTLINDSGADSLARYFSNQPAPTPVAGDPTLVAAGGKIFAQGDPEHGMPACAVCHGTNAAGFWIFPRLAGQHAEYVERQLTQIQMRLRSSPVMHGFIKNMTPDQMKAVAVFVQSK